MMRATNVLPFALSLSKGRSFFSDVAEEGRGFDKLSPNGVVKVSF